MHEVGSSYLLVSIMYRRCGSDSFPRDCRFICMFLCLHLSTVEVEAEFKAQRRAEQLIETLRAHADTAGVDLQQPQPDSDSLWSGKLIRMTSAKIVQSKQMQLALSNMNLVDNGNNSNTVSIDCSQLRVGEDMVESHQTGFKKSMSEPWSGSSMASAKYLLREPSQIEDHNLLSQYKYSVELNDDNDGEDDVELSQVQQHSADTSPHRYPCISVIPAIASYTQTCTCFCGI